VLRKIFGLALILFVGVLLAGAVLHSVAQSKAEASPYVFEMTAKKYDFTPDIVRVKKGTRVQLKIRATDRTHGFRIQLYSDGEKQSGDPGLRIAGSENSFRLEQNQERIIEFVAERPGTYTFRCSVFCGMGHRGMSGKIIVE